MVDGVISEARRIQRDVYAMPDLVIKMQNCAIDLDYLGCGSNLDAMLTLEGINFHLPLQL